MIDKKNWCFVYQHFVTGGLETYVLRMSRYLKKTEHKVTILCKTISEDMEKLFLQAGVDIRRFDKWNRREFCKQLKDVDVFISFVLNDYYYIRLFSKNAVSILYCVHDYHLTLQDRENSLINKIRRVIFRRVIKAGVADNTILIMNDKFHQSICDFYNIKIDNSCISYLPYEEKNRKSNTKLVDKKVNVLTICRADFPFKGYVIGLIDDFKSLNDENHQLTIVSYGNGINEVKRHIGSCPNIRLIEGANYEELETFYLNADIYVGMGSTIIEAASYGIPVINANSYDMSFKSTGLFNQNPHAIRNTKFGVVEGKQLLEKLMNMSNPDRIDIGEQCYNTFMNNYSMEKHCKKINSIIMEMKKK